MKTDIEIAREAKLKRISDIAKDIGIEEKYLEPYGKYIAKVDLKFLKTLNNKKDGKLILVTAITPTPAGEGKTTTSIGLSMALNRLGKKSIVTLREPSLGPVFGIKGGAAGGGYSQVLPMENINLHFTGDIHAISSAHNLISAVIDSHIKFGNNLNINPTKVFWKRTMDMNDRALRQIIVGLGGNANGLPREDGFIITAASEIMAILCLAKDLKDLKERLGNIVVAESFDKKLVRVKDLKIEGALTALLKDAINPNIVQTIENTPAFIHGGPFANIAHGTNSIIATKLALKLTDYVVTEAGFAADLGAEKFLDFVTQVGNFDVNAVVLVATIKALKYHGGIKKDELNKENVDAMLKGMENLKTHIENLKLYNVPVVVALNVFASDTTNELKAFSEHCNAPHALVRAFEKGSKGTIELANTVLENISDSKHIPILNPEMSIEEKIETLATKVYRARKVIYTDTAKSKLKFLKRHGFETLPVIVAKTQSSISDDPKKLNAPRDYNFTIRDFELSAGAGFVVALAGEIMRMPGLSKIPNAVNIDVDEDGNIVGLS
ncbi:formate--tetrahydrofolate ligase [Thermosipho melanesiensis]|uniref:Formate--tetrahydrofolate ligase n=2 Tax=Thermosipho melanesiensis TaxID=46541 RepID=FTHS_THEM4|nr:formate--tetrahydrofolate ligase [Thermosipho melanesiensis]A6LJS5.1 RecName: Full=Formate--tetrahydrofolate ligase; AltName: Full=Formyltetrahydrofolate synthetase; Short=FHS; Short=FTHFS [Thermosipho melanesiensis BI429]ABR30176.1 Formate--tetrahydrofolate ligase [Thermosipho melanesiensis BI429]APT73376.1 formate--tetrahydrofolate ligase [Thermosipho melanesiensis]OOC38191.1 formate--tetrahydrofolate ligase [Thermosipho melanesiensis]OOC40112.1 formate--tetrahydrofolate ligase [Thermosip